MKAIILSIKPEWWEKILTGEKKLEIRKTAPRSDTEETLPLTVLAYVSGTGQVCGQFMCPGWVKTNFMPYLSSQSCVSLEQLEKYAGGPGKSLYGWIVDSPEEYDAPKPLAEFGLTRPPMSWQYVDIEKTEEV